MIFYTHRQQNSNFERGMEMTKELMRYIPKEYKALVVDIWQGEEKEYDETTGKYSYPLYVEWENEEVSVFQNKSFAKNVLKEFHTPNEYEK